MRLNLTGRRCACLVLAALGVAVALQLFLNDFAHHKAVAVVSALGGRIGSIPTLWRGEYFVSFEGTNFTASDLERLSALNALAAIGNPVGIKFQDTNLTRDDIIELRRRLPHCVLFRVMDGEQISD